MESLSLSLPNSLPNTVPNTPTSPTSNRTMVWRLSSSTGSVTTNSGGSTKSKSQVSSTGRGGSGNIRRHSLSGDGLSQTTTRETRTSGSRSTTEEVKDDVVAPKGLELDVNSSIGIKSSGRGGSGNINGSRRLLQLFGDLKAPDTEALEAKEREVLAAHRAKKVAAQASAAKATYGRGGLGNLRGGTKPKGPVEALPARKKHGHRQRSSSIASRRSSSSSLRRRNQKGKESVAMSESSRSISTSMTESTRPTESTIRTSIDSFSYLEEPVDLFFEELPSPSPNRPIASTSKLPPPPQRPLPKSALPPTPALESPPSPLMALRPPIPNRPLNMPRATPPYSPGPGESSFMNSPPAHSRVFVQKQSAGGGAEWRLVTQVREERRGTRKYIIEEPVWELFSRDDIRREKQEAHEMKMMKKWVDKGKRRGWVGAVGDGYVSEPA